MVYFWLYLIPSCKYHSTRINTLNYIRIDSVISALHGVKFTVLASHLPAWSLPYNFLPFTPNDHLVTNIPATTRHLPSTHHHCLCPYHVCLAPQWPLITSVTVYHWTRCDISGGAYLHDDDDDELNEMGRLYNTWEKRNPKWWLGNLLDRKILLKWTLQERGATKWTEVTWLSTGSTGAQVPWKQEMSEYWGLKERLCSVEFILQQIQYVGCVDAWPSFNLWWHWNFLATPSKRSAERLSAVFSVSKIWCSY